ncbi:phage late control D family protein [Schinkia sp. CFF1]
MIMEARRAYLEIRYNNTNISKHIEPYVLGWTFTDNLSGQADDLEVQLQDRDQLWINSWMPKKGSTLKSNIVRKHWTYWGQTERAVLGVFDIDEIDGSGPPSIVNLKAISIPVSSSLKNEDKNRTWEKAKLSTIAKDIAKQNGVKLFYDSKYDPEYETIEQTEESDLKYLTRLCDDAGLCLKVANKSIVIFDEEKYELQDPIMTIQKGASNIKSYSFKDTLTGIYKSCRVEYQEGKKKKKITATFTPRNPPKTGRTLVINESVKSVAQAEILAKKRLRKANKDAISMTFVMSGDLRLLAGRTILVRGYGHFDGKYIITQAIHSQSNGYETNIKIRKCLEGY